MRLKDSSVEMCITEPLFLQFLFEEVDDQYRTWGDELVVTSGSEKTAKHSDTSLHYAGRAVDGRSWDAETHGRALVPVPATQVAVLKARARDWLADRGLPTNYIDIVLEATHIHYEWQPKYQR